MIVSLSKISAMGLCLFAFSFPTAVNAVLLVDPYIGYATINSDSDAPGNEDDAQVGMVVGGRVGYKFVLASAGLDVNSGSLGDFDRTNASAFAMVELPILLRGYAKYLLVSDLESDEVDADYDFDSGYVLGVGFTGLPFISLNFEYGQTSYDIDVGGSDYSVDTENYLLSVSLPMDF